jgi:glyceraldehyde 3-phosphate dehydrogenase
MAKITVGINGFGRIGRAIFRIVCDREDIEVKAINDIFSPDTLAHLLRYDSVYGRFPGEVTLKDGKMKAGNQEVLFLEERDPSKLPWKDHSVDFVIESTGVFRKKDQVAQHITAGAKKVLLTVPAKDEIDAMVVLGVNDEDLKPEHKIISNASCTTNCLAPVAKVLHDNFGIARGYMTTIHAYTNDQNLTDQPHKDLRRARNAALNIIPTTTGAARAVGKIMPALKGKMDGIAMRVPVATGSVVDLVAELEKGTNPEGINAAMKKAAEGPMKGILKYTEDPIVSSDIIGDTHSSIFDAGSTVMMGDNFAKVVSWYDNEWGYACRIVDLLCKVAAM